MIFMFGAAPQADGASEGFGICATKSEATSKSC